MTAPCRTCPAFLLGLVAAFTPACLHVSGTVTPAEPVVTTIPESQFAELPRRPGEAVRTNPGARAVAVTKPKAAETVASDPKPKPDGKSSSTSKRPNPPAGSDAEIPVPPGPPGDVLAVRAEPGPLPIPTSPPAPDPPLLAAMRAYAENRPNDAIECLRDLDRPNREFAAALLPLLVRGSKLNLAAPDPHDAAVMAEQFSAIAAKMEKKAALRVDEVAFCRKATSFGRYDPWPEAQPYRPNDLAILYVEIRHVVSEPAKGPDGESFVSRAIVSLEVRDAAGRLIEQTDPTDWRRRVTVARFEHTDYTRSPLQDYSRTYRISVPSQPGVYTVTVEVRDPTGNRTARSQPAEFRVAGP
jgi:hypothetical protein